MSKEINTLYGPVSEDVWQRASAIKLLICDVDGVFSDGRIYMGNNGEELKAFHTRDGYGLKALMGEGIHVAIITGRRSQIVENRMSALGVEHIYQGQEDKFSAYQELMAHFRLTPAQVAYIGDDLVDQPVIRDCALGVAVQDAHPALLPDANYRTRISGGFGAVREVCDLILASQGKLQQARGLSL